MTHELTLLVEQTRTGSNDAFVRLVDHLRQQPGLLVELAADPHEAVQRAVVDAARGLTTAEARQALQTIAGCGAAAVRQYLAASLGTAPLWPLADLAVTLLHDADASVRQSAVWAVPCRPALHSER